MIWKDYMKLYKIYFLLILWFGNLFSYQKVSFVFHVHSNYSSDTNPSIEEILQDCIKYDIDSICLTDHAIAKTEFGIKPFHRLLKKTVEYKSILKSGVKKYLEEINFLSKKYPQIIIFSGAEVAAAYYWTRDKINFVLNNYHKHMLVVGFEDEQDFYKLPVLGNEIRSEKFNFFSLWPILGILYVLSFVKRNKKVFIIVFLLILIMNYPFKYLSYDGYNDYNEIPYQSLINYINKFKDNKLIIWAHPDAPNWTDVSLLKDYKLFKIFTKTDKYYNSLLKTVNYDGFSIFAEGYKETGKINGVWDNLLLEYCMGQRDKPVWCFSEVDYGENSDEIYVRKNIVYVEHKKKDSILNSLKKGKFYSLWREKDREIILENFEFRCGSKKVIFGEEVDVEGKINISGEIIFSDNSVFPIKIDIIKNGVLIKTIEGKTPYKFNFEDIYLEDMKKGYYRIFIESKYPNKIATNPIFVKK